MAGKNPGKPECCDVVPILFQGLMTEDTLDEVMCGLQAMANTNETPEGVVVYYHAFRSYSKHTFKNSEGKWRNK